MGLAHPQPAAGQAADTITADFNFVDPAAVVGRPLRFSLDHAWSGIPSVRRSAPVADACRRAEPPRFDREGFERVRTGVADIDFNDEVQLNTIWRDGGLEAVKRLTGAHEVVGWGIGPRYSERNQTARRTDVTNPARRVHGDFSPTQFGERLDHADAETLVAQVARGRTLSHWIAVNVWQPVSPPPYDTPLALCEAGSVQADDVLVGRGSVPGAPEFEVDLLLFRHSPDYRWSYFSALEPGEALAFCGLQAAPRGGWRTAPHSAFDNPICPPDAAPRMSVEMRTLALFFDRARRRPALAAGSRRA